MPALGVGGAVSFLWEFPPGLLYVEQLLHFIDLGLGKADLVHDEAVIFRELTLQLAHVVWVVHKPIASRALVRIRTRDRS